LDHIFGWYLFLLTPLVDVWMLSTDYFLSPILHLTFIYGCRTSICAINIRRSALFIASIIDLLYNHHSHTMSSSFLKRLTDYHSNKHPNRTQFQPSNKVSRDMTFFSTLSSTSSQFLHAPRAPSRKRSQLLKPKHDDVDDFLSSDLELSFASTMSLNSPPRDVMSLQEQDVPMDISPAPRPVQKENERMNRPATRPRASTSAARIFGQDMSNDDLSNARTGSQANHKRTQRAALPMEWITAPNPLKACKTLDENMFATVSACFDLD
jgi:M-phase inducer tyrosine phosphatase